MPVRDGGLALHNQFRLRMRRLSAKLRNSESRRSAEEKFGDDHRGRDLGDDAVVDAMRVVDGLSFVAGAVRTRLTTGSAASPQPTQLCLNSGRQFSSYHDGGEHERFLETVIFALILVWGPGLLISAYLGLTARN
jgi:hypothetical protein